MEINHQSFEKSDQMKWISDDQGSGQVRSYTCAFCKRGFSNAQALGGHMNIHRRDRAKLKQATDENPNISMNPADQEPPPALEEKILFQLESPKRPSSALSREDDINRGKVGTEQLSLFVEKRSPGVAGGNEEKEMQLSQAEVDLELRLGPEPPEISTAVSTREFF